MDSRTTWDELALGDLTRVGGDLHGQIWCFRRLGGNSCCIFSKRPYTGLVSTAIMISRPRDWAFPLQYSILEVSGDSYTYFDRALGNVFQQGHTALSRCRLLLELFIE